MLASNNDAAQQPRAPIEIWKWEVLALVSAAFFIVVLDFSVVNVALKVIEHELKFTPTSLQWIVSAYGIVFGGFLLLGGRCSDLLGRRNVLLWGVGLFTFASLLCGLAGWTGDYARTVLIGARALQGLGGALIGPAALAIVNVTFAEGAERNRALGLFGSIATTGFACGNLMGGVLTAHYGWPAIFFVNVPLGIALILVAPRLLAGNADNDKGSGFNRRSLDIGGAVTVTVGLALFIYAVVGVEAAGLTSIRSAVTFGASAMLLVTFVVIESRVAAPLIPLRVFRRRTLTMANLVMMLIEAINFATMYFTSLYLQDVKRFTPQETGYAFTPLALLMVVTSNLMPHYVTRYGARRVMLLGTALTTIAPLLMTTLTSESSYYFVTMPILLLAGIGMAAANTAGCIAATTGLPDDEQGLASGLVQTSWQLGAAVGLAVLVTVSSATAAGEQAKGLSLVDARLAGMHAAFLLGTFFSGLGFLVTYFGVPRLPATTAPATATPAAVADTAAISET